MRKTLRILLAGCLLLTGACKGEEMPEKPVLSPGELSFAAAQTAAQPLSVTASGPWTAWTQDAWIHLSPDTGSGSAVISVSVDANETDKERRGEVHLSAGAFTVTVPLRQEGVGSVALRPIPDAFDGKKRASTTYQLLVYSFADSDGDGIGDFRGIEQRLDYLDALGVTALWLSPIHPSDSYHGYDVRDYFRVNPLFGTEEDFKSLVDAAHGKGIAIYLDYVLNHSGRGHAWFSEALSDPASPYRDYYFFSANPSADYRDFPMLAGTSYSAGEWKKAVTGAPKLRVSRTDAPLRSGRSGWNLWLWKDGQEGEALYFEEESDGTLSLVADLDGDCGMLLRKYSDWSDGSKFGAANGAGLLTEDSDLTLTAEGADIRFSGSGRYRVELRDYATETLYYMGAFSDWMPDLNYGALSEVENNACFRDMAASADHWIRLGVDGFRLDAVKHICGGIASYNDASNQQFLARWYETCNASFRDAGHSDDIFMVGEVWSSHNEEKNYYKGLNACFEFGYWPVLYRALTSGNATSYVSSVSAFVAEHRAVRDDAQTALFMTNHDHSSQTGGGEVRAADDLGRSPALEKQAAAMLLTSPGKPFIYQGEELGYWGNSAGRGDEYLRAPIVWDAAAKQVAAQGVNGKTDSAMLTGAISVERQSADDNSLLQVYRTWSRLRNAWPALAAGEMSAAPGNGGSIAAWYMRASDGQTLLVVHNVASVQKEVALEDPLDKPLAILGAASVRSGKLLLDAHSSAVFAVEEQ